MASLHVPNPEVPPHSQRRAFSAAGFFGRPRFLLTSDSMSGQNRASLPQRYGVPFEN